MGVELRFTGRMGLELALEPEVVLLLPLLQIQLPVHH
jgi:hypothetical protein